MRVLHVMSAYAPAYEWGGPIRSVPPILRSLINIGVEIEVYSTNLRGSKNLPKVKPGSYVVDGVPVTFFSARESGAYFFSRGLFRRLRETLSQFDIVHCQGLWSFPTAIACQMARYFRVPYVISPRGAIEPWSVAQGAKKKNIYFKLIEKKNLQCAAFVHCTTEKEKRTTRLKIPNAKIRVVYNPLPDDLLVALPTRREHSNLFKIAIVGRIHKVKGLHFLASAVDILRKEGVDVCVEVFGGDEGGYRSVVEKQVSALGLQSFFRWHGLLGHTALQRHLQNANCLVMPSYQENFGMAAAEAMALGLPVVVSDQVGLAEFVEKQDAGLVVPLDSRKLAGAIKKLYKNRRLAKTMGRTGRIAVRTHFSADTVAKKMLVNYMRALEPCVE